MAGETVISQGDPQAVERWSRLLTREAIGRTYVRRFMGTSNRSMIQLHRDLSKEAGDRIRFDLLLQMTGYGKFGDATLVQNEQPLVYHQHSLYIDQLREGTAFGAMSQQRTLHDIRQNSVDNIADFFARVIDEFLFAIMTGFTGLDTGGGATPLATAMTNFLGTSDQATVVRDEWIFDKGTGATSPAGMSIDWITQLRERAKKPLPSAGQGTTSIIRPIRLQNGEDVFALVLNPYQCTGMKNEAGSNKWREITAQADPRGSTNRIWTGALGMYDATVLHESIYLPYDARTAPGETSYGLFMGAQAGHIGFGNPYNRLTRPRDRGPVRELFSYFEDITDHGNRTGTSGASIFGMARSIYDTMDYGLQVLKTTDTAAQA